MLRNGSKWVTVVVVVTATAAVWSMNTNAYAQEKSKKETKSDTKQESSLKKSEEGELQSLEPQKGGTPLLKLEIKDGKVVRSETIYKETEGKASAQEQEAAADGKIVQSIGTEEGGKAEVAGNEPAILGRIQQLKIEQSLGAEESGKGNLRGKEKVTMGEIQQSVAAEEGGARGSDKQKGSVTAKVKKSVSSEKNSKKKE